ncbi:MAG: LacI family DNA-binding transcriptional regulator [Anaerolineae bacterium]
MATLQDVAQRAGVSIATVSKVLSNTPYFTEETRLKVMQAVDELGYVPNLAARALSSGKTHIIAVVFPYVYDTIFKDPLVMHILEGVETVITQQQHNLLLSTPRLTGGRPDDNYLQLIRSGYIDGVIAIDNVPAASVSEAPAGRGIPVIVIGHHPAPYHVHSDDFAGGQMLMEHILGLGHRRIGIITVAKDMNFSINQRMAGLQAAAEAAGLNAVQLPIAEGNFSTASGARAIDTLLADDPGITAIISLNDRMALGAVRELQRRGVSVPAHMSVVGYDDIALSEVATPALTTINQRAFALGQTAAQMLFEVLNNHQPSPKVLRPELVIRSSSAAPRL